MLTESVFVSKGMHRNDGTRGAGAGGRAVSLESLSSVPVGLKSEVGRWVGNKLSEAFRERIVVAGTKGRGGKVESVFKDGGWRWRGDENGGGNGIEWNGWGG